MNAKKARLAVVVKGWPRLSETFIAQELVALEKAGVDFDIFSLRHPTDTKTHPLHDQLQAQVFYLPEYLHDEPLRVMKGVLHAMRLPGFKSAYRQARADYARDRTPNRLRRFGQACVLARELDPDIVSYYAHFLHTPASVARYAAIMTAKPWSFSAHAKDIWTTPDWELREKLSNDAHGACFGATCTAYGAKHLRDLSAEPERIHLVYHGLDLQRFPAPPTRKPRDRAAPLAMMSVGRLVEKKGFDRLIEALALLPAELDWTWTHIGGGVLAEQMRTLADTHGVGDRIVWRGACDQPDVIAEMRDADLFVLPSRIAEDGDRDGLPNVLMEAASQKLPVLSTPVAAIPEFITSGVNGILVEDTPAELARAITDVSERPDKAQSYAEAAYAHLQSDFQMNPGIERLVTQLAMMMDEAS